ncbi:Hypothetical_protein [Hexamita inflata]|uniref:Hypothetical_protein n=1 Tax=Hexamita inflata TaxID=28002 RepID=A0AA86PG63_9EUKA|nr:Hypothetical protein HINF_LOCUS25693 [Hexamita inflata]CAI9938051.1 Hypothetical protein HINF_LOCUS25696 [Hexamita inflata]
MSNYTKDKQQRIHLTEAQIQRVCRVILETIRTRLNVQLNEFQLVQHYLMNQKQLQHDKLINWRKIDVTLRQMIIEIPIYKSKAYSYRVFHDVIIPNHLPPYPPQKLAQLLKYIEQQILINSQAIKKMSNSDAKTFRKDLEKQVKEQFQLMSTNVQYAYKKLSDKIRNYIEGKLNLARGVLVQSHYSSVANISTQVSTNANSDSYDYQPYDSL